MVFGVVVGPVAVAGLLPGALVSGVQLAISMSNTGGAWDNAKKLIESGRFRNKAGEVRKKRSDEHKAAVIGDTVGDPLKNNSFSCLKYYSAFYLRFFFKTICASRIALISIRNCPNPLNRRLL